MGRVLLGVSGGVAAYRALEVVRLATKAGHAVRVIQTPTAQRFVGAASFAALTGAPVLSDEFERDPARGAFPDQAAPQHDPLSHLELVRNADAFLIAPATANTIAKLAHGLADNLLTSAALAATCPVLVAPAMNNHMYEHAATQANLALLRERGVTVVDPGTGALGSRHEWGIGRLAEPAQLLASVEAVVPAGGRPGPRRGGPGARGGQGAPGRAGAAAGLRRGRRPGWRPPVGWAEGPRHRRRDARADRLGALRGQPQLGTDGLRAGRRGRRPRRRGDRDRRQRRPRAHAGRPLRRRRHRRGAAGGVRGALRPRRRPAHGRRGGGLPARDGGRHQAQEGGARGTRRRARTYPGHPVRARRHPPPDQTVVGFAAEHGEGALAHGRDKLARKGLDAVVVNDIARADIGFEGSENEVTIVTVAGERHVPRAPKVEIARAILEAVAGLRSGERTTA